MSENNPGGLPPVIPQPANPPPANPPPANPGGAWRGGQNSKVRAFSWWNIAPLISGAVFFFIFWLCARNTNLDGKTAFYWTNVLASLQKTVTNSANPRLLDVPITRAFTNTVFFTNTSSFTNTIVLTNSDVITNLTVVPNMFRASNWVARIPIINTNIYLGSNVLVGTEQIHRHPATSELMARLLWAVSCVAFAALCLAVIVQSIRIIFQFGPRYWKKIPPWVVILAVAFVFLLRGLSIGGNVPVHGGGQPVEALLRAVENAPDNPGATALRPPDFPADVPDIRHVVTWLSAAAATALFAAACACCYLLYAMRRAMKRESPAEFKPPMDAAHHLGGLTVFALIAGTIEVYLLLNLAAHHVHPILQPDVRHFATGLTTVEGMVYSGLLLAIFVPLIVWQREYGRNLERIVPSRIAGQPSPPPPVQAVQEAAEPSWQRILKFVLGVLAPVLTAFAAKLVAFLVNAVK